MVHILKYLSFFNIYLCIHMLFQIIFRENGVLECLLKVTSFSEIKMRGVIPYWRVFRILWKSRNFPLKKIILVCIWTFFNWNHLNDTRCTLFTNSVRFFIYVYWYVSYIIYKHLYFCWYFTPYMLSRIYDLFS